VTILERNWLSDSVERALDSYWAEYDAIVNEWLVNGTFGVTYPALLVETFHYVKHSCSLMELACARLGHEHIALRQYLTKHIAEETGHQNWVLNDLEALGYDRTMVRQSEPLAETINLIGSQLYVINYLHPAGLLGYVYLMESRPPDRRMLEAVQECFSISSRAMSFLTRHGEEDIRHRRELKDVLDSCIEGDIEQEATITSAVMGLANINRIMLRIRSGKYNSARPVVMEGCRTFNDGQG
jgi:Iron-containing redox enzyme